MPGQLMTSAMPATAPCSTSLAALKASSSVTSSPEHLHQLVVRDDDQRIDVLLELPRCPPAPRVMRLPSKANGLVTTATVRMPSSRATSATTGAAPVPVPPPMPAVMNTMLAPAISSVMRSRSSIGRVAPDLGIGARAQALGHARAELQLRLARGCACSACASVLMRDELHALHALVDHVIDRIAAAAAHAHHLDHRVLVAGVSMSSNMFVSFVVNATDRLHSLNI